MKKLITVFLCAAMLCVLPIPACAAAGKVSLYASAQQLHAGDSFTVEAHLSDAGNVALCTVALEFDEQMLELTGGSCDAKGVSIGKVLVAKKAGTALLNGVNANGKVFTFEFKVKEGAPAGKLSINAKASVSAGEYIDVTGTAVEVVVPATETTAPKVETEEPLPDNGPDPLVPTQGVVQPVGTSDSTDPTQDGTATEVTGSTEPSVPAETDASDNTTETTTDTTTESQPSTPARQNNWTGWIGIAAGAVVVAAGSALLLKRKRKKED